MHEPVISSVIRRWLEEKQAASPATEARDLPARPRLGLALAGGFARGISHIGVLRVLFGSKPEHKEVDEVMERAISAMRQAGAVLVDIDAPDLGADQLIAQNDVQKYEFKAVMDRYLATIPTRLPRPWTPSMRADATTTRPSRVS